jgi:hypothetical protein
MQRRRDRWAVWRTIEPDVQQPTGGSALRRRRVVRKVTDDRPDVLLRRWWIA